MPDVIVVGGGICGLQLSALLSSDGREVLVLEKLARVGGRAFLWEKDGWTVDHGIHLIRFGPRSALAKVFMHLGRPLEFVDLGRSFVAFPDGRVTDFPIFLDRLLESQMLSKSELQQAKSLFEKVRSQDPRELLETSVGEWMDRLEFQGGLRQYLHLVCASMQVCPDLSRASAGELLLNLARVLKKGYAAMYPEKGWRYIYQTLTEVIEARGRIRTGAAVKRVMVEAGRVAGVELTSGERIAAPLVVVNLPVQQLFEALDPALVPPAFVEWCRGLKPTAGLSIDYGLSRKVSEDRGLWYFWAPMSFGVFTSNLCPELAPPGKQLLTWFRPAEPEEMADPEKAQPLESALETAIFRTFPGLESAIEWRRAVHLQMVDGVEVNVRQHREKRPGYRVPGLEGLFLVGDSLKAPGAGGDVGHEAVLECYTEMTGRRV